MMTFPYIVAFYSYKGGVGRSLALMNVAFGLIKRGRNVLVVDMDLEAPGISGFLSRNKELARPFGKDAIDLVEMAIKHVREHPDPAGYASFFAEFGGVDYAVPIAKKKLDLPSIQPRLGLQGRLDVIGVRPDDSFIDRLTKLGLGSMAPAELQLTANALRGYLKTRRIDIPPLPGTEDGPGAKKEPVPYDYVLVDSRTGVTDAGGLSIGPLSDRLVVLTGLNDQNVIGTRDFLKYVGLEPREWFTRKGDKPWDSAHRPPGDGPAIPRGLGPKPTLIVASPVPPGEIEPRQRRLEAIRHEIGPVGTWIPYHPLLAVFETIFVRDYPDEQVSYQYDRLTALILAGAMDDPRQLLRRWLDSKDRPAELPVLVRLAAADDELGEGVLKDFAVAHDDKLSESDVNRLYATLTLPGATEREVGFSRWGDALSDQAKTKQGEPADRLFEQAYEKYRSAVKIKPDMHEALYNWGLALSAQAKTKQGAPADRLFKQACEKYRSALKIKPDDHEAFYNWGVALSDQAETKQGEPADRLFGQACEKYRSALKIKPDKHEAFNNWGAALISQAKTRQGERRRELLGEAQTHLLAGERLKEGSCAFNLACIAALLGQADDCRRWLQVRLKQGKLTAKLMKDSDLDSVRDLPWFKEVIATFA